jgi:hypothetical protein
MGVAKTISDDSEGMMASFSSCNYRETTAFLRMVLRFLVGERDRGVAEEVVI